MELDIDTHYVALPQHSPLQTHLAMAHLTSASQSPTLGSLLPTQSRQNTTGTPYMALASWTRQSGSPPLCTALIRRVAVQQQRNHQQGGDWKVCMTYQSGLQGHAEPRARPTGRTCRYVIGSHFAHCLMVLSCAYAV